jgi:predicted methyltransferase
LVNYRPLDLDRVLADRTRPRHPRAAGGFILRTRSAASSMGVVSLLLLGCTRSPGYLGDTPKPPGDIEDGAVRVDAELRVALAGPARKDEEKARDVYRHPRETLEFFGLRDGMRVVELYAPDGYYTAILAPVLRDRGSLTVTLLDPQGDYPAGRVESRQRHSAASRRFLDRLDQSPDVFGKVSRVIMKPPTLSFGPDGAADLVVTFRNVHNWIPEGYEDAVFAGAFRALKRGGILGVVEHRGAPEMTTRQIEDTGYVPEALVRELAAKAGLLFDARSEINANPKDTKDYPDGVWSLPPFYALRDKDRAKYTAIGESDRMTLRFVKP